MWRKMWRAKCKSTSGALRLQTETQSDQNFIFLCCERPLPVHLNQQPRVQHIVDSLGLSAITAAPQAENAAWCLLDWTFTVGWCWVRFGWCAEAACYLPEAAKHLATCTVNTREASCSLCVLMRLKYGVTCPLIISLGKDFVYKCAGLISGLMLPNSMIMVILLMQQ